MHPIHSTNYRYSPNPHREQRTHILSIEKWRRSEYFMLWPWAPSSGRKWILSEEEENMLSSCSPNFRDAFHILRRGAPVEVHKNVRNIIPPPNLHGIRHCAVFTNSNSNMRNGRQMFTSIFTSAFPRKSWATTWNPFCHSPSPTHSTHTHHHHVVALRRPLIPSRGTYFNSNSIKTTAGASTEQTVSHLEDSAMCKADTCPLCAGC